MDGASTLQVQILSESWGCLAPCASWRVSSLPFDTLGVKLGSTCICSALLCRHYFAQRTGLSAGQCTTPWLMGWCPGEWKNTFYLRISVPQILEFEGTKNSPEHRHLEGWRDKPAGLIPASSVHFLSKTWASFWTEMCLHFRTLPDIIWGTGALLEWKAQRQRHCAWVTANSGMLF